MTVSVSQPRQSWRFRRCPKCRTVRPASEFAYVGTYRPGWHNEPAQRSCPCGYQGQTSDFAVVRERHPDVAPYRDFQLMLPTAPRSER